MNSDCTHDKNSNGEEKYDKLEYKVIASLLTKRMNSPTWNIVVLCTEIVWGYYNILSHLHSLNHFS